MGVGVPDSSLRHQEHLPNIVEGGEVLPQEGGEHQEVRAAGYE